MFAARCGHRVAGVRLLHNIVVKGDTLTADLPPLKSHRLEGIPTTTSTTKAELMDYFQQLTVMRRLEVVSDLMYKSQQIRGFCHLYDGQEAIAVGMEAALTKKDYIITAYRDHCTQVGRGDTPEHVLAELMGRGTGCSKGKGGSMHMYLRSANFFGGNGIVGAQVPVGTGLAFAAKYFTKDQGNAAPGAACEAVSVSMFGDGAANQGQINEAMNMAHLWKLPVIYVVENNQFGMGTSKARASSNPDFYLRYDVVPGIKTDGMDVHAVREVMKYARDYCMEGNGPILVEMDTYRYHGHSMSDPGLTYRSREEVSDVRKQRDPIEKLKKVILTAKFATEEELKDIERRVKAEIDTANANAQKAAEPDASELYADVLRPNKNVINQGFIRGTEGINNGVGTMLGRN